MYFFDLDGTLTESKQPIPTEAAERLTKLPREVGIVSGSSIENLKARVQFPAWLVSCNGAEIYSPDGKLFHTCAPPLASDEFHTVVTAFISAAKHVGFVATHHYGDIMENRGPQVTFSLCGQAAPVEIKKAFARDNPGLRDAIARAMQQLLPDGLQVSCGGITSLDVSRKRVNKAAAITEIMLATGTRRAFFVGDKLAEGGNDHPVTRLPYVTCLPTPGVKATIEILDRFLDGTYSLWSGPSKNPFNGPEERG